MADPIINALLCGDFGDSEMQSAVAALAEAEHLVDRRYVDSLAAACRIAHDDRWSPDLLVIAQKRPGQYLPADIRALQQQFPLARTVCCLGAWCESEGRNSDDWPAATRVAARTAAARIRRELAVLAGQRAPLPLTAARDEIFAFDSAGDWAVRDRHLSVRVMSLDRKLRGSIEELLVSAGCAISQANDDTQPDAVIWDADPWDASLAEEIRAFCLRSSTTSVIALLSFEHPENILQLQKCGVHAVVPKLSPAGLLLDALDSAMARQKASGMRQLAGSPIRSRASDRIDQPADTSRPPGFHG